LTNEEILSSIGLLMGAKLQSKLGAISALDRILRNYENNDTILFDPVNLPRSSKGRPPVPGIPSRRSDRRLRSPRVSPSVARRLPALPEDENTLALRQQVNRLDDEVRDLDIQIQLVQRSIADLRRQLDSVDRIGPPPSRHARLTTAPTLTDEQQAQWYKQQYEEVKRRFDRLNLVLEHNQRARESGANHFRQPPG
jgi:hypothetical protein